MNDDSQEVQNLRAAITTWKISEVDWIREKKKVRELVNSMNNFFVRRGTHSRNEEVLHQRVEEMLESDFFLEAETFDDEELDEVRGLLDKGQW